MKSNVHLVIMAGGSGTRFWPRSTSKKPKQFLSFSKNPHETLLGKTLCRFDSFVSQENRWVVTTETLKEPMKEFDSESHLKVLVEPQGRNTAPCVFWAAKELEKIDSEAIMMVMPADHYIPQQEDFLKTIHQAVAWAETHDDLVTLGIQPNRPETGYGYLKKGQPLSDDAHEVSAFVEKPNLETAQTYYQSGEYLWNAGMFVWKVKDILRAFDEYMPEMNEIWKSASEDVQKAYPQLTATSIDYGIMEKAKSVVTFPLDCGWDDLGSWTSLENVADALGIQTEFGVVKSKSVVGIDSTGNIVDAPEHLVALLGVHNLIVVDTGKTLMVADKSKAQDIKQIVEKVKEHYPSFA
ncbi:MAG: mannose-1-phosphate guanylyltransferase [Bdellovibrionaceae bacterium]|nr:mannose-1-phosphate guanylyltransferase [Pseudobdellovibrionaceae bacterium]|tara:strand:- start:2059 stop:3114 length:1056 start_codon:yes stop_codon:yes gene_type:complete